MMSEKLNFVADMHTHTIASTHAYSTITENALWCSEHGIKYLGMTDHGIKMQDSPDTWHFENLGILPEYIHGVRIIRGIEANIIDSAGNIDIENNFLYGVLEWINASFHPQACMPMDKDSHTKAYLGVINNPRVDVICHSEDKKYPYDIDEVCRACAEYGKLIEVNCSRLERHVGSDVLYEPILEACEKYGTGVIVNSDAHFYTKIGDFHNAVALLERVGFPEKLIINANEERFINYYNSRNAKGKI